MKLNRFLETLWLMPLVLKIEFYKLCIGESDSEILYSAMDGFTFIWQFFTF